MADSQTGKFDLMMQTRLGHLRSQLNLLRRKRLFVRWGSAVCNLFAFGMLLLVAAFVCDWMFNLSSLSRSGMLVVLIVANVWAVKRWIWPLTSGGESLEDIAIIVEQQSGIDSDLVAALQFDQPQAGTWGSSRLTTAVVDYVSEFSPSLNVFEGFSYRPLPRRSLLLGATMLLVTGTAIAAPHHAATFWNRLFLGTAHYPTRTRIQSISVSGQEIPTFHPGSSAQVRIPYGVPIVIQAKCEGEIPATGLATLSALTNDSVNRIDLRPGTGSPGVFQGEMAHLTESFRIGFQIGDAFSDPAEVIIVPLPLVDVTWSVTPPQYASATLKQDEFEGGSRQFSVLEGSQAQLKLVCVNKTLNSARLTAGDTTYDLVASHDDTSGKATWTLPPDTPFKTIREPIKYEIQVTDRDGLSLETPITGQVRLKSDRPPRIAASAVTRHVLPSAQPTLDYAAIDDFGIAAITAIVQISREGGEYARHELPAIRTNESKQPSTTLRGQVSIPLASYELTKGDEVKVSLQVTDWRGSLAGQLGEAEAIRFNVTDLNGIFAQTGEEDRKSAKQLDEILRRELGISGENK